MDGNDTAYLEYHAWRNMPPPEDDDEMPQYGTRTTQMSCDLCKEIKKRKEAGWAKRTIKSVASWWWLNVHDEKCTDGFDIPDWIKKFPVVKMNETYDEMKL